MGGEDTAKKVAIGGAAASGTAAAVTAAGFSQSGIVAGSVAAVTQSAVGNVAAGSTFAMLQSAGATGTVAVVGASGGLLLVVALPLYIALKLKKVKSKR